MVPVSSGATALLYTVHLTTFVAPRESGAQRRSGRHTGFSLSTERKFNRTDRSISAWVVWVNRQIPADSCGKRAVVVLAMARSWRRT